LASTAEIGNTGDIYLESKTVSGGVVALRITQKYGTVMLSESSIKKRPGGPYLLARIKNEQKFNK
jgi:hypothetical protein